ncbi:MAG: hypothetical protein Q4C81_00715 [Kocuria sp.]|nr:hypothetical protein [Kocuria sp.]
MKVDMSSNTGNSPGEAALQPPPEDAGLSRAGRQLRFLAVGSICYFGLVTVGGILVNSIPLYISRYFLGFESPPHTLMFQEIADFISGPILGTALAMVFRWAAMDLIVFRRPELDNIEKPKAD